MENLAVLCLLSFGCAAHVATEPLADRLGRELGEPIAPTGEGEPCALADVPAPNEILFMHAAATWDPSSWTCRKLDLSVAATQVIPNLAAYGPRVANTISMVRMGSRARLEMARGVNPGGSREWAPNTRYCSILSPALEWTRVTTRRENGVLTLSEACEDAGFTATDGISSLIAWVE